MGARLTRYNINSTLAQIQPRWSHSLYLGSDTSTNLPDRTPSLRKNKGESVGMQGPDICGNRASQLSFWFLGPFNEKNLLSLLLRIELAFQRPQCPLGKTTPNTYLHIYAFSVNGLHPHYLHHPLFLQPITQKLGKCTEGWVVCAEVVVGLRQCEGSGDSDWVKGSPRNRGAVIVWYPWISERRLACATRPPVARERSTERRKQPEGSIRRGGDQSRLIPKEKRKKEASSRK